MEGVRKREVRSRKGKGEAGLGGVEGSLGILGDVKEGAAEKVQRTFV